MSDRYWRCMVCNFPDASPRPEKCPKCGGAVLFGFDNETNFMFRRLKWDRQHQQEAS